MKWLWYRVYLNKCCPRISTAFGSKKLISAALELALQSQWEGWRMVNARLCEMARPAFFSARQRLFYSCWLWDRDWDPKTARRSEPLQKRDCETRENWWDCYFFRDHSPPLLRHLFIQQLHRTTKMLQCNSKARFKRRTLHVPNLIPMWVDANN